MKNHIRPNKLSRTIVMLGLVSFFTDVASEMIYPLIPVFVAALGSGALVLGIIEGIAESTASLLKLVSGVLSDRWRKRKLLVFIGYFISSLVRPLTGLVSSAWHIVFIRMVDRIGKGIRTAPRDALIAAFAEEHQRGRAFGFQRAMDHSGAVVGPLFAFLSLIGLVLIFRQNDFLLSLRWTFIFSLVPGLIAVWIIFFHVQEKTESSVQTNTFNLTSKNFDRNFLTYLSIVFFFTLGNSSDAFLLLRVQEAIRHSGAFYHLISHLPFLNQLIANSPSAQSNQEWINILFLPLVWAFFHIIKALFSTPLGTLSDKIGRKTVISLGWGIYTLVYFAFAYLDKLPGNWQILGTLILFSIYAMHYAFCESAEKALVVDIVPVQQRGSAYGLYNFAIGIGTLPASIFFGIIYSMLGAAAAFSIGAVIALISVFLLLILVKEPRTE